MRPPHLLKLFLVMAVMGNVKLARFARMMMRVRAVAGCAVRMMRGDLVIVFLVVFGGIAMMLRGFLVMIRGMMMMFACGMLMGHMRLLFCGPRPFGGTVSRHISLATLKCRARIGSNNVRKQLSRSNVSAPSQMRRRPSVKSRWNWLGT